MLGHRLLWVQSSESGIKALALSYRSSFSFDPEYWELNISTNLQQIFPLINNINYWYFDEKGKIELSIRRIENASCFAGGQVLLYTELMDLQCFWFLVTFLHRAQYTMKRFSQLFSAVLSQTHWWLFICFLSPGIRSVMNKTEILVCISLINVWVLNDLTKSNALI